MTERTGRQILGSILRLTNALWGQPGVTLETVNRHLAMAEQSLKNAQEAVERSERA